MWIFMIEKMAFNVYKSSAGSGKTYTLVREYIQLCLVDENPQNFKSILAITFTNKAAAEMKERVFSALKKLSIQDPSMDFLHQEMATNLKIDKATVSNRAKNVLTAMLHQYSSVAISTIDKFVHKIVKSFSRDLNLPSDFEIELDAKKMLTEAIELVLAKIGNDEKITKLLYEFTESKASDEEHWNVEGTLQKFALYLLNDEAIFHLKNFKDLSIDDFLSIREKVRIEIEQIIQNSNALGSEGISLLNRSQVPDSSTQYKGSVRKFFVKLTDKNVASIDIATTQVIGIAESGKHYSKAAPDADKAALNAITSQLNTLIFSGIDFINSELKRLVILEAIADSLFPMALLNEINQAMIDIREEKSLVHISAFNKLIAEVVSNEPAPFIYERLGEKYAHFLIDEFQDTSVTQFQNLLPLIENSLASGGYNMLVGDAKQSIYRWRGGEVEQFVSLPNLLHKTENEFNVDREQSLVRNYQELNLQKNFRSQKQIIEFNNLFFDFVKRKHPEVLSGLYKNHEQLFDEKLNEGYVQLKLVDAKEISTEEWEVQNCKYVLDRIHHLTENGFSYADIACIFRNNKQASLVASYLSENNIPVLSRESLLVQNNSDVHFLVSCLQLLAKPYKQQGKLIIVAYLNKRLGDKISFDAQTTERVNQLSFTAIFKEYGLDLPANELLQIPLFELLERILKVLKLEQENNSFVAYFLDYALGFMQKPNATLQSFLDDWELNKSKLSVSVPDGLNAVNILTIHKSKGLEFPVVIFPFANWMNPNETYVWQKTNIDSIPELKVALIKMNKRLIETDFESSYNHEVNARLTDDVNLLYVTFTRAKKQLYILADRPKQNKKLSELFVDFLQAMKKSNGPDDVYEHGTFCVQAKQAVSKAHVEKLSYQISAWRHKIDLV